MTIDKNDPFLKVLEYLLGTEYENTITKLEEKEIDNMNEEIKSMKTLEACAYLQDHKDEYLVAKDNENFELHLATKGFETKYFVEDSADTLRNKLTLDFSTLNTEWVIPIKKRSYRISGYVKIIDSKNLVHSDTLLLSDKEHDDYIKYIEHILWNKYKYTGGSIFVKSELMLDENLNVIIKMS